MSWSKAGALTIAVLLMAACGFQPLYGPTDTKEGVLNDLAAVKVNVIADRVGQQLRNELEDLLTPRGQPSKAAYVLRVTLRETITEAAVERTGLATRENLRLDASFTLTEVATGAVLLTDRSSATSSYNILDEAPFSTLTSENDARRRNAKRLAENIRTRLGVYFRAAGPEPGATRG